MKKNSIALILGMVATTSLLSGCLWSKKAIKEKTKTEQQKEMIEEEN